jgi:hypothetical protein
MRIFILLFAIVFFSFAACAQSGAASAADWVTIENENKELAFSIPKDHLVNIKTRMSGKDTTVNGYQNGVTMEVYFSKDSDAKERINRPRLADPRKPVVRQFAKNDFLIHVVSYGQTGYDSRIFVASKKFFYIIEAKAASKDKPELSRFLRSITLNGERIFNATHAIDYPAGEVFTLQNLKTSERITKILDSKAEKIDRKVKIEPLSAYVAETEDSEMQEAILLTDLRPPPPVFNGTLPKGGEFRVKMKLLASGQVGDITVYTDADKSSANSFANAAKSMKFVPAFKNGVSVDSYYTSTMWTGISLSPGMLNIR